MACLSVVGAAYAKKIKARNAIVAFTKAIASPSKNVRASKRYAPMIFAAELAMKSAEGKAPKFQLRPAYAGGLLHVARYEWPICIDLSGLSLNPQNISLNMFHDADKLLGHVDGVTNDGRTLSLAGVLSGLKSVVAEFLASARAKFPWKCSVEVRPLQRPEAVREGQSVHVNGRRIQGPCLVSRKSELYAVAVVEKGADENTSVVVARQVAK